MISEPEGVAKMTGVMMMMTIHHTVYPVSDAPVRDDLQMLSCFMLWPSNFKDTPLLFLPGNQTDSN